MEAELLEVCIETATVKSYNASNKTWYTITPFSDKHGYLFVRVHYKGFRKAIALHRLVWLVANGEERIPPGHDVAHLDDDNSNNHYKNLELQTYQKNRYNKTSFGSTDSQADSQEYDESTF